MTAPADGSPTPLPAPEPEEHNPPASITDLPGPADPPSPSSPGPDPSSSPTEVHPALAATSGDNCPSCGAPLAVDQRYCLECGQRRGDPRLPFMDAVVFMEAINQPQTPPPPPPPKGGGKPRGLSANASLIAGIATLVLAIGVGVLIGRSGDNGTNSAAATPQILTVPAGGTETSGGSEEANKESSANGNGKKKSKGKSGKSKQAEEKSETGSSGQSKAAEDVLEPKVPQAKPEAELGETCVKGTAGCSNNGKFEGEFFGE